MQSAYDEAIEFISRGMTADELVAFRPSAASSERYEWLIRKEKTDGLLPEEKAELDRVMEVERVLSLAKARACARLNRGEA
ncbi:MAG TPA: hypothetical protein VGO11_16940 [Chthoniobacteraceae bacterium]|jgi:hypothetical protein|nr:hypothetical protein [Chthoniobacteraceae bacterium]